MQVPDWQYKFHVITCGSKEDSSLGFVQRNNYSLDDFRRRTFAINDLFITCVDDANNNLCTEPVILDSARSTLISFQLGLLFGLYPTNNNGCGKLGDGVSDTPAEVVKNEKIGCPGLLPYNKDRDLYKRFKRRFVNKYKSPTECHWGNKTCPNSICASCTVNYQNATCCKSNRPSDSCKWKAGIDPGNNVMTLAPDICIHELTPGQLVKMMAQVRVNQIYFYCNYATIVDTETCTNIPCASNATSPNCKK
jgi:hypothetical protein